MTMFLFYTFFIRKEYALLNPRQRIVFDRTAKTVTIPGSLLMRAATDLAIMKSACICRAAGLDSHWRIRSGRPPRTSAASNSALVRHGAAPENHSGTRAPLLRQNWTKEGKLSSNLSVIPAGNQMKCPMPREGNASPRFQETSPFTVPAHSFCQIFRAIFAFTSPASGAA